MQGLKAFGVGLVAMAALYAGEKQAWDKPAASWTAEDIAAVLNKSPWAVQTEASVDDPYDAQEEQPVAPPETGQKIPGQGQKRWDGEPGHNRMGHLPTVPALVRWESARPVRDAEKEASVGEGNWYVISVEGLIPAGRYRDEGKIETSSRSDDMVDAKNPEEVLEAFMTYSRLAQSHGPNFRPEDVKLDAKTGVVRIYFARKSEIDPEGADVIFTTHFGKLNLKVKFKISSMKYQGNIAI